MDPLCFSISLTCISPACISVYERRTERRIWPMATRAQVPWGFPNAPLFPVCNLSLNTWLLLIIVTKQFNFTVKISKTPHLQWLVHFNLFQSHWPTSCVHSLNIDKLSSLIIYPKKELDTRRLRLQIINLEFWLTWKLNLYAATSVYDIVHLPRKLNNPPIFRTNYIYL